MAAPTLDSLSPSTATVNPTPMIVILQGSGFTATDVAVIEGADAATTFVDAQTLSVDMPIDTVATLTVSVRNDLAEVSNALAFLVEEAEVPVGGGDPDFIPETPEEGASPNTEAVRAEYHAPEPADVYQGHPVQVPPESTATGVPRAHTPDPEELPTTNAYKNGDGGLPNNPREPYPTGHPRADTWARLQGAR